MSRFVFTEPKSFHLKGKHNQKTHGGNASHVPDVTDTLKVKSTGDTGVGVEYQDFKGEQWLKLDTSAKKKWHKVDDLEVVSKGAGIGSTGDAEDTSTAGSTGKTVSTQTLNKLLTDAGIKKSEQYSQPVSSTGGKIADSYVHLDGTGFKAKKIWNGDQVVEFHGTGKTQQSLREKVKAELDKNGIEYVQDGPGAGVGNLLIKSKSFGGSTTSTTASKVDVTPPKSTASTTATKAADGAPSDSKSFKRSTSHVMTNDEATTWSKDSVVKDPVYHFTSAEGEKAILDVGLKGGTSQSYANQGGGTFFTVSGDVKQSDIGQMSGNVANAKRITARLNLKESEIHTEDHNDYTKTGTAVAKMYQDYVAKYGKAPGSDPSLPGLYEGVGIKAVRSVFADGSPTWYRVMDMDAIAVIKSGSKATDSVKLPNGSMANVVERTTSKGEKWVKVDAPGKKKWYLESELEGPTATSNKTSFDSLVKDQSARKKNDDSMESQRQDHAKIVSSKLTQIEKDTLYSYSATQSLSEDVNGTLRYKGTRDKHAKELERLGYRSDTVDVIDSAIAKAPLDRDTTVYRGVGKEFVDNNLGSSSVGKTFTDYGYASTSTDSNISRNFAGYDGAVMVIDVPKGYNMLPMTTSAHQNEREYLLPRSTTFRINQILSSNDTDGSTKTFIHVTVIEG